jgi:C4-dicarboxylate transporter DctM subunit
MNSTVTPAKPEEKEVVVKRSHYVPAFLIFSLLSFVVLLGLGDSIHSRLLVLGEKSWEGYYLLDPSAQTPSCDINQNIENSVQRLLAEQQADSEDDLFGDDLFSDEGPSEEDLRVSLTSSLAMCQEEHQLHKAQQSRITPSLEVFKSIETSVAKLVIDNIDIK